MLELCNWCDTFIQSNPTWPDLTLERPNWTCVYWTEIVLEGSTFVNYKPILTRPCKARCMYHLEPDLGQSNLSIVTAGILPREWENKLSRKQIIWSHLYSISCVLLTLGEWERDECKYGKESTSSTIGPAQTTHPNNIWLGILQSPCPSDDWPVSRWERAQILKIHAWSFVKHFHRNELQNRGEEPSSFLNWNLDKYQKRRFVKLIHSLEIRRCAMCYVVY